MYFPTKGSPIRFIYVLGFGRFFKVNYFLAIKLQYKIMRPILFDLKVLLNADSIIPVNFENFSLESLPS